MSGEPVLVGIDIGTSGARALAINLSGNVIASASRAYPLHQPLPGWSEQNPDDWWGAAREVLREVGKAGDVVGIGLTGQMHGAVFLDARGEVIRPALLWNDQRTSAQCAWIEGQVGRERLVYLTGNPALTGFQAPKIVWLRDTEPENFARVHSILLPKDFIRFRLTGERVTDVSDAAGTLLLDVRARDWSQEVLDALELSPAWLPIVLESPQVGGVLSANIADDLGLRPGIPVAAGAGDNAAAAIGTGIIEEGIVSSSIGTSGVIFAHTADFAPDPSGRLHAFCHAVPRAYHLMGVTLAAGGSLRWWRDIIAPDADYPMLVDAAADISPGSDGLYFLPYLSGERTPHMDPHARGAFIGLTTRHTTAHMTRAVMEGVVYSLRDSLEIMRALGVRVEDVRAVGGGSRHPLWRQLQADIFHSPVRRTTSEEGPAYGAALLAGVASGTFPDVAVASACVRLHEDVTEPDPAAAAAYDAGYAIYRELYAPIHAVLRGSAAPHSA